MRVAHLVEAMGGAKHLWGKEEVIQLLLNEQRNLLSDAPIMFELSESFLGNQLRKNGFIVETISTSKRRFSLHAISQIRLVCRRYQIDVLHTHGYKANIMGRVALRVLGHPTRLVSTSHGFDYYSMRLRAYNSLDCVSAFLSDRVTVTAPAMAKSFPYHVNPRFIPNGLPEVNRVSGSVREATRRNLGIAEHQTAIGMLNRLYPHKGIDDFIACAQQASKMDRNDLVFVIAGAGPMAERVQRACDILSNVRYAGYVPNAEEYLDGLDVFVQASHREGLSIALLQAMRAGLTIVATDVGATATTIRSGVDGIVLPPKQPDKLFETLLEVAGCLESRSTFGVSANQRYRSEFTVAKQNGMFFEEYACAMGSSLAKRQGAHHAISQR